MKRTDVMVDFSCNNNCLFCMLGDNYKKFGKRGKEKIINDLKESAGKCDILTFCGGEPTIHEDILELVKIAKKIGFKELHMQTNGRMLRYAKLCKGLIAFGVDSFTVSLHSSEEEKGDFLSKTPGSFKQTVNGIKNVKKFGAKVITNTVISKKNYQDIFNIVLFALSLKVDQIQLVFIRPRGKANTNFNLLVPSLKKIIPYVSQALKYCNNKKIPILVEGIPLCLIPSFEKNIAENYMPEVELKSENIRPSKNNIRKVKFSKCKKCKKYYSCEGIWKEYADVFKDEEFKPLIDL